MGNQRRGQEYMPLRDVIPGNLFVSLCQIPLVAALAWAVLETFGVHPADLGTILVASLCALALSGVLVPLWERPFVVRRHHPSPGGLVFAAGSLVVPVLCGLVVGLAQSVPWGMVMAAVMLAEQGAYVAWMKPWRPGMTVSDMYEKVDATREMTHRRTLENGWTPAAKKNLQAPRRH